MNLKAEHISKKFDGNDILKDVSLEVRKGEILSLTGESGCGKSTLLRIIAGLESADTGKVLLNDQEITHWTPEKRKFGFVFQNISLFPHLSVKENIFYAIKRKEQTEKKLQDLLQMTGLNGLDKRYPHELSGGQQQRVALARVLAIDPKLLLLDEPFSSLDELLKIKIREEIFDLLKSLEITTILVSHQATDAFLIADKLIVMREGEIKQQGHSTNIYQNPISPYVSDLFGASVIINGKSLSRNLISTPFGKLSLVNDQSESLKIFVRPENIDISTSNDFNLSGKVLKKEFKGPHDVMKIGNRSTSDFISLETERCSHDVGDLIYLKVPENKIKIF